VAGKEIELDKAELKKLLVRSKKEPVNCAVGEAKTGQALIQLHKIKQPRAVSAEMEKEYGVMKNLRWGKAEVDVDADPKLVILFLNRAVSGMARKLKKTLKGTGFSKVEIRLEDGSVVEAVGEEEEDGAEHEGEETAQAPQAGPDAGSLGAELAALIPRVQALVDARAKADAAKLATQANVALKAANLEAAMQSIGQLKTLLDSIGTAAKGGDVAADGVALGRELAALIGRIAKETGADAAKRTELSKLAAQANAAHKGQEFGTAATLIERLRRALDATGESAGHEEESAEPDAGALAEYLTGRLQDAKVRLARLMNDKHPATRDIAALFAAASKSVESKAEDASARLDVLENSLRQATAPAGGQVDTGSTVSIAFRKLLIDWHKAQDTARDNLRSLGTAFLDLEEVQNDPRYDEVEKQVSDLVNLVPDFGDQLDTAVNALLNTGGKGADEVKALRGTLQQYRQQLTNAPALARLEKFAVEDLGAPYPVHAALSAALSQMEQQLANA
jgi:hypothetical protein